MFIDWEHQLILNKVTYPMAVLALVLLAFDWISPGTLVPGGLPSCRWINRPS
jgi:hypothetical protein